ncbi:sigma-70 family RNA polymerase sigma factor, partial [bacterium]|nr:sigma-70 family RNA polymerase sigma factor [bacterium]
ARNAAFDQLRKRKIAIFSEIDTSNADTDSGDGFGDSIADESMLADEIAHQAELGKSLSHALATLPPAHRAVVILHDFNEMTFEEIAEMSDVPMNTVKSQYRRSLITLRKLLVGDDAPKP